MKEQLISFETAKLAKEKGFDWKHSDFYIDKRNNDYEATPQSLLQKWLREEHGRHIEILLIEETPYDTFYYRIMQIGKYFTLSHDYADYNTYEEALEEGLQQALKLIP